MKLMEFFEEPAGGLSSSRLVFVSVWFVVIGVWAYSSFVHKSPLPLDTSMMGVLGIISGQKLWQRFAENAPQAADPPAKP